MLGAFTSTREENPWSLKVFLDKADRVADILNAERCFLIHVDIEFVLEGSDQLDALNRLGSEVLDKSGVVGDSVLIHAERLRHDSLDAICVFRHFLTLGVV